MFLTCTNYNNTVNDKKTSFKQAVGKDTATDFASTADRSPRSASFKRVRYGHRQDLLDNSLPENNTLV